MFNRPSLRLARASPPLWRVHDFVPHLAKYYRSPAVNTSPQLSLRSALVGYNNNINGNNNTSTPWREPELDIETALKKYKLSQWGYVVFRCTYRDQEKWDKFVALAKGHARDYCQKYDYDSVHDRLCWTVIEDPVGLDDADIFETTRRFNEWVERGPGRQERPAGVVPDDCPRYTWFVHVDEESLESIVDDVKARERDGYFCKVVHAGAVSLLEQDLEKRHAVEGEENNKEQLAAALASATAEERAHLKMKEQKRFDYIDAAWEHDSDPEVMEEELSDLRKRVRIDILVDLYAEQQRVHDLAWYHYPLDRGRVVRTVW
ncbi:hypothetical protein N658DRAFT_494912 [Parathielavia hyrcaniae]|uniref:Uncharacterized protein n=1 Tax=Parathielavia hyrcaniae TaxID=113614 RepID=A0AAN6Q8U5_9PEZI|nr:hypothetical protein N658DRAFT_494912 [Parathielavia hyrcaniae]